MDPLRSSQAAFAAPGAPAGWNAGAEEARPGSSSSRTSQSTNSPSSESKPIVIGARTINSTLMQEARYPSLENYITHGLSSDYSSSASPAWSSFQKVRVHEIPSRILEKHDDGKLNTMMGLFAELQHAWITVDNALYIWNFADPNPDIIGVDEQPNCITAVRLVVPRKDVFIESVKHLLVIATTASVFILGLSSTTDKNGRVAISIYQTKMTASIRGLDVTVIESSPNTGRIFFGGRASDDVYELMYQPEEGWFQAKCYVLNHTKGAYKSLISYVPFLSTADDELISQIVVDDSRSLVYSLSSKSTIRVFFMKTATSISLVITRTLDAIKTQISHMVPKSSLLSGKISIVSISAIPADEAMRVNLVAVTSTGIRIFLSITSSYSFIDAVSDAPSSMQVVHVKFPPPDLPGHSPAPVQTQPVQPSTSSSSRGVGVDLESQSLSITQYAIRFPPGFFIDIVRYPKEDSDSLFMSAPDCGLIARTIDIPVMARYMEATFRLPLKSSAEDIGLITPAKPAAKEPTGYGNELATQYDEPVPEIAVLTNTGIHTMRRRRLVDTFASLIRTRASEVTLDQIVKKFVQMYGRQELIATALGVACGQAVDVTDARIIPVSDQAVAEAARTVFVEHGGRATINETSIPDNGGSVVDLVRPSPRHAGLALYISRLVRSVWNSLVIDIPLEKPDDGDFDSLRQRVRKRKGAAQSKKEARREFEKNRSKEVVKIDKLRRVQQDLIKLSAFLEKNKIYIEGLVGPESISRAVNKQEELALQGEHRAMYSLFKFITTIIECISFSLVMSENNPRKILQLLPPDRREEALNLRFQELCRMESGRDLAREIAKAIVNYNIANGSSVETVADALRRRCGSFCSADDVVIFKARERLTRAADSGPESELARGLLNESLRLFLSVSSSLGHERLGDAVEKYIEMAFFAGAVRLILEVAAKEDPGNRALGWLRDGMPDEDPRREQYEKRLNCYVLIQEVITGVDSATDNIDPRDPYHMAMSRRQNEAYAEINSSTDEVFQNTLLDWYMSQDWTDRILAITSEHVVLYLKRKSKSSRQAADLLCRYYTHHKKFYLAAEVQYELASGKREISLVERINYLTRAKSNASAGLSGIADLRSGQLSRDELLREITFLLDIALIQQDILTKIQGDTRIPNPDALQEAMERLDGQVMDVTTLFQEFAEPGGYHDICLTIYSCSDFRDSDRILKTWSDFIQEMRLYAISLPNPSVPHKFIASNLKTQVRRVNSSPNVFLIEGLLRLLLEYTAQHADEIPSEDRNWAVEAFLDLDVPFDAIAHALAAVFTTGPAQLISIAVPGFILVLRRWYSYSIHGGGALFGGGALLDEMKSLLDSIPGQTLNPQQTAELNDLRRAVAATR